jgi:FMN phosphatase YigB (HAD superfamily)
MGNEEFKEIPIRMITPAEMSGIQTVIWDADGSFYPHDSPNHTFTDSTLHKLITQNTLSYIQEKEQVSEATAKLILWHLQQSDRRLNEEFIDRYHVTKEVYYERVWGPVDPKDVVREEGNAVALIRKYHAEGKYQILLTSSPNIWQRHLIDFLGLNDCFQRRYYAELYNRKPEIFSRLAQEFTPSTVASFGDQLHSDIAPAYALNMRVFHITSPQSLLPFLAV